MSLDPRFFFWYVSRPLLKRMKMGRRGVGIRVREGGMQALKIEVEAPT